MKLSDSVFFLAVVIFLVVGVKLNLDDNRSITIFLILDAIMMLMLIALWARLAWGI